MRNGFCFITVYTFVREFLHKLHNNFAANTMTNKCDLAIFRQRFIDECKFMANLSIQAVKRFIPCNQTGQKSTKELESMLEIWLGSPFKINWQYLWVVELPPYHNDQRGLHTKWVLWFLDCYIKFAWNQRRNHPTQDYLKYKIINHTDTYRCNIVYCLAIKSLWYKMKEYYII